MLFLLYHNLDYQKINKVIKEVIRHLLLRRMLMNILKRAKTVMATDIRKERRGPKNPLTPMIIFYVVLSASQIPNGFEALV